MELVEFSRRTCVREHFLANIERKYHRKWFLFMLWWMSFERKEGKKNIQSVHKPQPLVAVSNIECCVWPVREKKNASSCVFVCESVWLCACSSLLGLSHLIVLRIYWTSFYGQHRIHNHLIIVFNSILRHFIANGIGKNNRITHLYIYSNVVVRRFFRISLNHRK